VIGVDGGVGARPSGLAGERVHDEPRQKSPPIAAVSGSSQTRNGVVLAANGRRSPAGAAGR
jgi:hypothetical protein